MKRLHHVAKGLKEVAQPKEVSLIEYQNLRQLSDTIRVLNDIEGLSVPIREFESQIEAYNDLKNYLDDIKSIKRSIKIKKEQLEKVESRIKDIEAELGEFKVCPLCHKPL